MYSEALLKRQRFSRRFNDCCYLLRTIWAFDKHIPFDVFWSNRSYRTIIQNKALKNDLEAACRLCNIAINPDNLLLVLACVRYRFAIHYIQKMRPVRSLRDSEMEKRAITYGLMVKYAMNKMQQFLPPDKSKDDFLDANINSIVDWLEHMGYGPITREIPDPNKEDNLYFLIETISLRELANSLIRSPSEINKVIRDRETIRNYNWWRKRQQGLKYTEIVDRCLAQQPDAQVNEDIVIKAVQKYNREHGSLGIPCFHLSRQNAKKLWINILEEAELLPKGFIRRLFRWRYRI